MAAAQDINDNNKRINRECAGSRQMGSRRQEGHGKGSNSQKKKDKNRENDKNNNRRNDDQEPDYKLPDIPEPEHVRYWVFEHPAAFGLFYNGDRLVSSRTYNGRPAERANVGQVVNFCKRLGPGVYEEFDMLGERIEAMTLESPFTWFYPNSYTYTYEEKRHTKYVSGGYLLEHMYLTLVNKMRTVTPSPLAVERATAIIEGEWAWMTAPDRELMLGQWMHHLCATRKMISSCGLLERSELNDRGFHYQANPLVIGIQHHGIFSERGTTCEIPSDWNVREDVDIVCSAGAHFTESEAGFDGYEFDTDLDKTRYYKTVYMKFQAPDANFLIYDVNGTNACKAIKRLVAKREDEETFDYNQMSMFEFLSKGIYYDYPERKLFTKRRAPAPVQIPFTKKESERFLHAWKILESRGDRRWIRLGLDNLKNAASWGYNQLLSGFYEHIEPIYSREYSASLPHVKARLRRKWYCDSLLSDNRDILVSRLSANVKRETAKPLKVPRLYVGYEGGCMYAPEVPELVKVGFVRPFYFPAGTLHDTIEVKISIMSKPSLEGFNELINELAQAQRTLNFVHCVIFSDDMVMCGNVNGRTIGANLDISSCDSSARELSFFTCHSIMAKYSRVRASGLVSQCNLPITLKNPDNPSEKIKMTFPHPFEGSGTVLTTILNHCSSYMIVVASAISDFDFKAGAKKVGFKLTVDEFGSNFEKLQFLKRSPLRCDDGSWTSYLNLGCIFRNFGSVEGDLTHEHLGVSAEIFAGMSPQEKGEKFMQCVVASYKHEPNTLVMNALRRRFDPRDSRSYKLHNLMFEDDLSLSHQEPVTEIVGTQSLEARYEIIPLELTDFVNNIAHMKIGDIMSHSALAAFYKLDYDLV